MSKIEWTGKTWNPITGCSRTSEGCKHCYAERMTKRLAAMGQAKYQGLLDDNGRFNSTLRFDEAALEIPLKRKQPTVWFVNSMSDLFHKNVWFTWQAKIWAVMAKTPHHTYQILTKRADALPEIVGSLSNTYGVLPNVWLGVSVEDQRAADERIPHLLQTPAAVRFLSCEPLLGPVDLAEAMGDTAWKRTCGLLVNKNERNYRRLHWVIAGGESGPGARPMHPDWARSLRDQCVAMRVPFFMKQWGEWLPNASEYDCYQPAADYNRQHVMLGDVAMVRVGKKAAGRLLDGRTWDEMPEVSRG